MDRKNTTGAKTKTIPRLIVKIVGSKQVKQFIQEPDEETHRTSEEAAAEAAGGSSEEPAAKPEASHGRQENRENSALWDVIKQVPDRSCVTAPGGDRSRSYIHPRTPHVPERRGAAAQESTNCSSEQRGTSELASAVRRELSDWPLSSLRSAEVEVAALDLSSRGTVSRPDVTHLFLKNDVPLKLPTFSLLLQMFAEETDPEQIHHRNLLHFIETSAFPEERN